MKKLLVLLLVLFLSSPALAEMDLTPLKTDPDWYAFPQGGTLNTIYRAVNQPYIGQTDDAFDGELVAYVDFITLVDRDVTLLRLMASTEMFGLPLGADQLRLTVAGKRYAFSVSREESEYDGLYMEDYTTCLVGEGLTMLKAIAQQKKDHPIAVELLAEGSVVFTGQVIIPGEEAAAIYDRFIDMGGKKQSLKALEEQFPCKVEKTK